MPSSLMKFLALSATIASSAAQATTLSSSKRGLVFVESDNSKDDAIWSSADADLTWYYNYRARPTSKYDNTKLQFVPMLWGGGSNASDNGFYATVKELTETMDISYVLGFNEPDGCANGGSCMDASDAAAIWKSEIEPLKDLGIKLGAPAVTGGPSGWVWLREWFTACDGGCTPDFLPIHWYGNFEGLASHVGQANATYQNMTMWCTEYAYPHGDLADSQDFYNNSAGFFDSLSYMTHYSYFGAFRSDVSNVGPYAAMLNQNGELTDIGAWYLGQPATGNESNGKVKNAAVRTARSAWLAAVTIALTMFLLA